MNVTAGMFSFGARAGTAVAILSIAAGLSACGERGSRGRRFPVPWCRTWRWSSSGRFRGKRWRKRWGRSGRATTAAVAPQVMGRLTGVAVSEGSVVAAGALLATIDDTTVRAQLSSAEGAVAEAEAAREEVDRAISQAEAAKGLAEKTFERYRKLLEGKVVTQQEFDEVEMRRTVAVKELERAQQKRAQVSGKIAQARGQADAAKAMLAWTRVIAPFAGVIVEKRADAGSMAVPGVPLFVLEDPRGYRIEASVSETYLPLLKVGTTVQGILDADPGEPFPAVVTEVVPEIDPATRTFTVKADLPAGRARSGQSGKVRFAAGTGMVLAVPKRAITRAGGSDGVFDDRRPGQHGAPLDDHRRGGVRRPRGSALRPLRRGPGRPVADRQALRRSAGGGPPVNATEPHAHRGIAGRIAAAFIGSRLTPLVIIASVLLGVGAVLLLPREEEPQIMVPMIDVFVRMPGASATEVEERVTRPMEKLLWEIPGVEYVYSTSPPGQSMAIVRFQVGQDEENSIVRLNQKMSRQLRPDPARRDASR